MLTTTTIKLREVAKFYRSLYSTGGGGSKPCKTSRLCEGKCITFKLSKFTNVNIRRSFQLPACRRLLFPLLHKGNRRRLHAGNLFSGVDRFLPNDPHQKLGKAMNYYYKVFNSKLGSKQLGGSRLN